MSVAVRKYILTVLVFVVAAMSARVWIRERETGDLVIATVCIACFVYLYRSLRA